MSGFRSGSGCNINELNQLYQDSDTIRISIIHFTSVLCLVCFSIDPLCGNLNFALGRRKLTSTTLHVPLSVWATSKRHDSTWKDMWEHCRVWLISQTHKSKGKLGSCAAGTPPQHGAPPHEKGTSNIITRKG